jgi:predicted MFS family arabinose efflux permease
VVSAGAGLRALAHRDFRWLWLGQSASTVGDRMVLVALALFVTEQTGRPTDIGLVLAANTIPLVLVLLIGGVWADRLPRERIMVATDLVRCALHATLAALIFAGDVGIGTIMVIEALFGTAEAFFRPAYAGLIPQTVPEDQIQAAQALTAASDQVAEFAGPALATALVVGAGAGWAFTVDAATFVVSAALLLLVRPRSRAATSQRATLRHDLAEGFREVRARAWVWVTVVGFSLILMVATGPWMVLGPELADEHYGSASTFGVLAALVGAGTIAGAVVGLRWSPRFPLRIALMGIAAWPVFLIAYGLGAPLALVAPLAVGNGVAFAVFDVLWSTALAQRIPPAALSRVSAYDWVGSLGLLPLGYLAAGPLAEAVGTTAVVVGGGVASLLILLACLAPRATRDLPRLEGSPTG